MKLHVNRQKINYTCSLNEGMIYQRKGRGKIKTIKKKKRKKAIPVWTHLMLICTRLM